MLVNLQGELTMKKLKFVLFCTIIGAVLIALAFRYIASNAQVKAKIYLIDGSIRMIVPCEIKLPNPKVSPKRAMSHLIRYLTSSSSIPSINILPEGVKVNDISFDSDTLVVDFNSEFLAPDHWSGSEIAYLRIQALAHSLTSVFNVKRIRILVDGRIPNSLGGHEEIKEAIEPDPTVVKNVSR